MKYFLRHFFLPHHTNNHRAKILHHTSILSLIVVLLFGNFSLSQVERQFSDVLGITANISSDELLLHTNLKRQENGLPPLVLNGQLSQAAAGKAQDMITKNYWAHIAPDGLTPWAFINGAGYRYIHAGENLARGFTTSGDVVNAWMESPGHRDNILSKNYTEVGFAILSGTLTGEETVLVVEMLGSRTGTVASAPSVPVEVALAPTATPVPVIQVTPTPFIAVQVIPTPPPAGGPTLTPTPVLPPIVPQSGLENAQEPVIRVASVRTEPLVDSNALSRNTALIIIGLLLVVLVTDMIIIKKKKIVRAISHHGDQILFYSVLFIMIIMISRGSIL